MTKQPLERNVGAKAVAIQPHCVDRFTANFIFATSGTGDADTFVIDLDFLGFVDSADRSHIPPHIFLPAMTG
ncbi:MAG: hypothetical protein ACOH2R_23480 [Pseudomonas sp.]